MKNLKHSIKGAALAIGVGAVIISPVFAEPGPKDRPPHAQLFQEGDKDGDGVLTLEEITAVRPDFPKEAFTRMDKNTDGKLAAEEFERGRGGPGGPEGRMRLHELLREADTNGDKEVSRAEFDAAAPDGAPDDAFDRIDRNDDGVISREDRPEDRPGGPGGPGDPGFGPPPGGPHGDPHEMFDEVDTNDDGKITHEEHMAHATKMAERHFKFLDENGDGVFSKDEIPEHGPGFGPPPGGPHGDRPQGDRPDGTPPAK